jgi:hypothetical protein
MVAGPCYIALAQIAQKTLLPPALLLLRVCLLQQLTYTEPLPSNGHVYR